MVKLKRIKMTIDVHVPEEVDIRNVVEYVKDAVDSWGGQFHPEDPLFEDKRCRIISVKEMKR